MKCLVVESSPTVRRAMIRAVQPLGDVVLVVAERPHDAIASLENPFELILVGWSGDDLSAIELVRAAKEHEQQKDARIVIVTTRSLEQDVHLAIESGVDDYLLRPFAAETLTLRLERLLTPKDGEDDEPARQAA